MLQQVITDQYAFSWRFYVEVLPSLTVSQSSSSISFTRWTSGAWFSSYRISVLWENCWRRGGIKADRQTEGDEWRTGWADWQRQGNVEVDQLIATGEVWVLGGVWEYFGELEVNVHLWRTQRIKPPPLGTSWKSMLCSTHLSLIHSLIAAWLALWSKFFSSSVQKFGVHHTFLPRWWYSPCG